MVIDTDRLVLRPLTEADIDRVVELHADPEVGRFVQRLDHAAAAERVRTSERQWRERGHGLLAIIDRSDGRFLGRTGLNHWPDRGETEVAWVLRPDAWGRGLATEAARACLEWGFRGLQLPRLTAMIRPGNERSIRVARRLGLTPLREDVLFGNAVVVYAIDRERWPGDGAVTP